MKGTPQENSARINAVLAGGALRIPEYRGPSSVFGLNLANT